MNEETILFRLEAIEKKLDGLINIQLQTQAQEIRLSTVENEVKEIKSQKRNNVDKWLNPLISACISGLIAFIFVKVGLR